MESLILLLCIAGALVGCCFFWDVFELPLGSVFAGVLFSSGDVEGPVVAFLDTWAFPVAASTPVVSAVAYSEVDDISNSFRSFS